MDLNEVEDIMETLDGHSDARIDSDKIRELCWHIYHLDEEILILRSELEEAREAIK